MSIFSILYQRLILQPTVSIYLRAVMGVWNPNRSRDSRDSFAKMRNRDSASPANFCAVRVKKLELLNTESLVVLICIAAVALLGGLVVTFLCWRRSSRPGSKPGIFSRVFTTSNEYFENKKSDDWLIEDHNLEIDVTQKLGSGAFSTVYKGKLIGAAPVCRKVPSVVLQNVYNNCDVAVKVLPPFSDLAAQSDFIQEINFMKSLVYHPHLVCMLGIANKPADSPCLVVEFCEHGDLLHFIRRNKKLFIEGEEESFRIRDLLSFAWQISDGLYFLNSKDIIHRDVAARNVLLDSSRTAKIGDFGLCRCADHAIYHTRGGRLPLKWMAIESLIAYEYSTKSDVWSLGVLFFELFSLGDVPFPEVQPVDLIEHLEAGNRLTPPDYCTEPLAHLMQRCWIADPESRVSIGNVRDELSKMLESSGDDYGYFKMKDNYYFNTPTS